MNMLSEGQDRVYNMRGQSGFRLAPVAMLALTMMAGVGKTQLVDCDPLRTSVVRIEAAMSATGVIVGATDHALTILTAYHPLPHAPSIKVAFWSRQNDWLPATLEASEPDLDIALLRVALMQTRHDRTMFIDTEPAAHEIVTAVGHPTGLVWQCLTQAVTATESNSDHRYFQFFSPIWEPGLSGAPVFDPNGELAGIAVRRSPSGDQAAVKMTAILQQAGWQQMMNLAQPRRNPNALSGVHAAEVRPDGIVLTVDYQRDSLLKADSILTATPLDGPRREPPYAYGQAEARITGLTGTAQVGISGLGDGLSTSAIRLCMLSADDRVILFCKLFPFRKKWPGPIASTITSLSMVDRSHGTLRLRVAYTFEMPAPRLADQDHNPSTVTITGVVSHVRSRATGRMDFTEATDPIQSGAHAIDLDFKRDARPEDGDTITVCFDSADQQSRFRGMEFGCRSERYPIGGK